MSNRQDSSRPFGFHRVPEHHVVSIQRWQKYHRTVGPGTVWINPFYESILATTYVGLRTLSYRLGGAQTNDPIEFGTEIVLRFRFDPRGLTKPVASEFVQFPFARVEQWMRDLLDSSARDLFLCYSAEQLCEAQNRLAIQHELERTLAVKLRPLGVRLVSSGGVLLKRIDLPSGWYQAVLEARRNRLALAELDQFDLGFGVLAGAMSPGLGGPGAFPMMPMMPGNVVPPQSLSGNGHSSPE